VVTFGQKDAIGRKIHQELEKSTMTIATILATPWLWFMKLQYQAWFMKLQCQAFDVSVAISGL